MRLEAVADAALILRTNELAYDRIDHATPAVARRAIAAACARARAELDAALAAYFKDLT